MRRILAVLNLVSALGVALLMHALYRLAAGKTFETAEAAGVIGGADGPPQPSTFLRPAPVPGLRSPRSCSPCSSVIRLRCGT